MTREMVLNAITSYAKVYRDKANESIQDSKHMNNIRGDEVIDQRHIDAVLVDFINFIGVSQCVDYALYTSDLTDK